MIESGQARNRASRARLSAALAMSWADCAIFAAESVSATLLAASARSFSTCASARTFAGPGFSASARLAAASSRLRRWACADCIRRAVVAAFFAASAGACRLFNRIRRAFACALNVLGSGRVGTSLVQSIQEGMGDVDGGYVGRRDDDACSDAGQIEQALCKAIGEAHTAVRSAIARKRASMQSDARPGDPLHKRHLRVLIEVGDVISILLQDCEDASGRLVGSAAGRDGGLKDRTLQKS